MNPENQIPSFGGIEAIDHDVQKTASDLVWPEVTPVEQQKCDEQYVHAKSMGKLWVRYEVERQRAIDEHQKATTDSLTGLYNRRGFLEAAQRALTKAAPSDRFVVLFADLDKFKTVNDTLGHDAGDDLLNTIGGVMRASFPNSVIARFGGDEFTILHKIDCSKTLDISEYSHAHTSSAIQVVKESCVKSAYKIPGIPEIGFDLTIGASEPHPVNKPGLLWKMLQEADEIMLAQKPDRLSSVRRRA